MILVIFTGMLLRFDCIFVEKEMLDFTNTETAFAHLSTRELKRTLRVFSLMKHAWILKAGKPMLQMANVLHFPLQPFLGKIYNIFVAGKTLENAEPVMEQLKNSGIFSIPDYSAEGEKSDAAFDAVADEIKKTILFAAEHRNMVPFAVFKPSGISPTDLLEKKSKNTELNPEDEKRWESLMKRWDSIFKLAAKKKVSVMVDAEESWYQQAVDDMIFIFMLHYNAHMPVVMNTLQMYRNDRLEFLDKTIAYATENNLFAGIKFVRGAYHEKENLHAAKNNTAPKVYQTKPETDAAFNLALKKSIENIDRMTIVCATHNEDSTQFLTDQMQLKNLAHDDHRIWFSQLLGMSNHISFNLAAEKYNVAKYLPYAPIATVMPYLLRRAEENSSMRGQTLREYGLLKTELERRIRKQNQH